MPGRRLGILRECHHPRANHQHGTLGAYTKDKCRCDECADARSVYGERVRKDIAYGRYMRLVDVQPVREHLRSLGRRGIGYKRAASLAGVAYTTTQRILSGEQRRVTPKTAAKILAVSLTSEPAPGALVDGTGSRRRIEALVRIGWPVNWLCAQAGLSRSSFDKVRSGSSIQAANAQRIRDLYERYWDQPPVPTTPSQRTSITRTIRKAEAKGYAPPLAWDDDTIDDPNAKPDGTLPPRTRRRDFDSLVEDVEWLMRTGSTADEIADRLGLQPTSVEQALRRGGRGDLANLFGRKSAA